MGHPATGVKKRKSIVYDISLINYVWKCISPSRPPAKECIRDQADTVVQGADISLQPHLYCFIDMLMTKYIPRSYEVQNKSEKLE